jgi:hypothetical protein
MFGRSRVCLVDDAKDVCKDPSDDALPQNFFRFDVMVSSCPQISPFAGGAKTFEFQSGLNGRKEKCGVYGGMGVVVEGVERNAYGPVWYRFFFCGGKS